MRILRHLTLGVVFLAPLLSQNLYFSGGSTLRIGEGKKLDLFGQASDITYNEILFDANLSWERLSLWMQLEYSDPPEYGRPADGLRRFRLNYAGDDFSAEVGDLYRTWGRGLVLSQFDDQQIDFDNSIRGLDLHINQAGWWNLELIAGNRKLWQSTPGNPDDRLPDEQVVHHVGGAKLGLKTGALSSHLTYLQDRERFPFTGAIDPDTSQVLHVFRGISMEYQAYGWELFAEYAHKWARISPPIEELDLTDFTTFQRRYGRGEGIAANMSLFLDTWSITVDYKKYAFSVLDHNQRDWYPKPEGVTVFQNPPLGFMEHSTTLLNRSIHQLDVDDEIGYQITLLGGVGEDMNLLLNYSRGSRNKSWFRKLPEEPWDIEPWEVDATAGIVPLSTPGANPFSEVYGELTTYFLEDALRVKLGFSNAEQIPLITKYDVSATHIERIYEFIKTVTIPVAVQAVLPLGLTLDLNWEWQRQKKGNQTYTSVNDTVLVNRFDSYYYTQQADSFPTQPYQTSIIYSVNVSRAPYWGINFQVDRNSADEFGVTPDRSGINPLEELWRKSGRSLDRTWLTVEFVWNISSTNTLRLKYGSEQGGIQCSNGVCRYIQPFSDGLRLTLTTLF